MTIRKPSDPPPRTKRSGEYAAVKNFYKELEMYNTEVAPALDKAVEKMSQIAERVTTHPDTDAKVEIPPPPRTPSMVDEDELTPTTPKDYMGELDGNKDSDQKS